MDNRDKMKRLLIYLGIPIALFLVIGLLFSSRPTEKSYVYSDIVNYFEDQQVTAFSINMGTGEMRLQLNDESKTIINYTAPNSTYLLQEIQPYVDEYNANHPGNARMQRDIQRAPETSWLVSMLPMLIVLGLGVFLWWFMMKRLNSTMGDAGKQMNFGKAKIKQMSDEKRKTTFADVAGADEEKEELNRKAVAIERMLQSLYPEWERIQSKETKPEIKELMQELGRSKAVTHRKIRNYLQSGRNPYSLVDGRKGEKNRKNEYKVGDPVRGHGDKTVANDEHLEEVFQDGYQYFLKGKEAGVSLKSAYRYLVGKHYMTQEYNNGILVQKMASLEEIPTYKRFWTYCNKQNDRNGITPLKMSAKERRNNARLLRGNSQSGCLGPGHIVEVDEVEIDMINVSSRDSRQVVGRAVMYLAIDVYSCCIVGCWVDYANNSFVGITNLLMALTTGQNFRKK